MEQLLWDLPEEERLDAVWYYEDYFADAGPENENRVLRELKNPETVADNIRAGYLERLSAEEGSPAPDAGMGAGEHSGGQREAAEGQGAGGAGGNGTGAFGGAGGAGGNGTGAFGGAGGAGGNGTGAFGGAGGAGGNGTGAFGGAGGRMFGGAVPGGRGERYSEGAESGAGRGVLTAAVLILLIIFALPISGMLLAFCVLMLGLFAGFGIGGVAMVLIGNGITNAAVSSGIALLFSGAGLIVAAFGIFFIVFAVNCGFRAVPSVFRGVTGLLRRLTGRRAA